MWEWEWALVGVGVELEVKDIGVRANSSPLCSQPSSAKRNLDEFCLTLVYSGAQTSPQYCSCAMHVANFAMHIVH